MSIAFETPVKPTLTAHPVASLLPSGREDLLLGLAGALRRSVCAADQHLGHLEESLLHGGQELFRQMLETAAQQKAEAVPPLCPHCQNKLSRLSGGHWTTLQTRFGWIRIQRARGYCKRCRKWRFPADPVLGLPEAGTQSPAVQEMAALTVSQMPAPEAEQVIAESQAELCAIRKGPFGDKAACGKAKLAECAPAPGDSPPSGTVPVQIFR